MSLCVCPVMDRKTCPGSHVCSSSAGCGELLSVGEPVTHRKADNIEGKYGVWMQDPEAVSPYAPTTVWRIDTIGADVRKLFGYEDMEQLSRGFPSKVETIRLYLTTVRCGGFFFFTFR